MSKRRNVVRVGFALAMGAGLVVSSTGTAFASGPGAISAQGTATGALEGNGLLVAYACSAEAAGAVATAITSCNLTTGGPTLSIALPGEAAAIAGVATVPLASFKICWSAVATFVDASTKSTSGCSIVAATAVGGPTAGVSVGL